MEAAQYIERVTIPYAPRPFQRQIHADPARFQVLVCHRRFGKTVYAINKVIRDVVLCPHEAPRGMYCCPFLKQAKSVAWDYLIKFAGVLPDFNAHKGSLSVDFMGDRRITLAGADNVDAHRGIYLDSLVCDEYAQMSPRIWGEVFRPTLADRTGKGAFIGTPKGRNNGFYDMYDRGLRLPDWKSHLLTVADTNIISAEELASARLEMTDDEYAQEFMCSWDAAIKGAYWAKEMSAAQEAGRICNVPHEQTLPVHIVCDLGMRDSFAIWFVQFVGKEVRFIDYKEYAGMGLPAIVAELRKLDYIYGEQWAPHDIMVRELGTGTSRWEVAASLGVTFQRVPNIGVQDGIDAARAFISRCWFDREKCRFGLDALRSYHSKYDDVKRIDSNTPDHDWSSHGADAFRYAAVTWGAGRQAGMFDGLDYSKMNRRTV